MRTLRKYKAMAILSWRFECPLTQFMYQWVTNNNKLSCKLGVAFMESRTICVFSMGTLPLYFWSIGEVNNAHNTCKKWKY